MIGYGRITNELDRLLAYRCPQAMVPVRPSPLFRAGTIKKALQRRPFPYLKGWGPFYLEEEPAARADLSMYYRRLSVGQEGLLGLPGRNFSENVKQ